MSSEPIYPLNEVLLAATNPIVAELVRHSWRRTRDAGYSMAYTSGLPAGKQRLLERLRKEGFLEQLVHGPEHLPDPMELIPPIWQTLLGIGRPKSTTQLLDQIINLLDWYCSPVRRPTVYHLVNWGYILLAAGLVAGVFGLLLIPEPSAFLFVATPIVIAAGFGLNDAFKTNRLNNAYVLYVYLTQHVRDTERRQASLQAEN